MEATPGIKKIREVRALCDRSSVRRKAGLFVTEGERICNEIPGEDLEAVYMSSGYRKTHPGERCDYLMKDADFARLADTRHPQGILAVVKQKHYELKDLTGGSLYIILETIQDPGNLGTIIRTAEAAGVSAVIMNKGCVDIYSPKVVRSTMGSIFRVPFIYSDDLTGTIRQLKEDGIVIYAADLSGTDMYETAFSERKAYVIGNEANGVSSDMISLADRIVKIPMAGQVDSLNAAVSAAVLMYRR